MAFSTPRTWSANEVLTAANMNTYISNDLSWLAGPPRASLSATLTIPTGTTFAAPTAGTWSGFGSTGGDSMVVGTTTYYLTAPAAGFYLFTATAIFSTSATGKRGLALTSGAGGTGTVYAEAQSEAVAGTEVTALTVSCIRQLAASSQVHIGVRQSSGANMSVTTRFAGIWQALAGSAI